MDLVKNDEIMALFPEEIFAQRTRRLQVKSLCRNLLSDYERMPKVISLVEGDPAKSTGPGLAAPPDHIPRVSTPE